MAVLAVGAVSPPVKRVDPMGRILQKADFERVLATRSCSRSLHFALHHVSGSPTERAWQPKGSAHTDLSTGPAPGCPQLVDDSLAVPSGQAVTGWWLGCVVPKRHAKRAVTRNLLKRQVRAAFQRFDAALPTGLWLVRLRAPFSRQDFVSAKSTALAAAARAELDAMLSRVSG
jgi:ribonuclease P protein component